ncbi:MAG: hypothetical protein ISS47_01450 [Candidatus Omnitrophica bacterium]|nr:hypothetical protein [Candidatus Omnitrophota bacterium]
MNKDINNIANTIISNFKNYYINENELISRTFPVSSRTIFDNFDDLAPFFIYFKEEEFLLEQIHKLKKLSFDKILAHRNIIFSYTIDEYLGGLFALWKKTGNREVKKLLDIAIEKTKQYFISEDNIFGTFDIYSRKHSMYYYPWSSGILETFLEFEKIYPGLKDKVIEIMKSWLSNPFFLKFKLFPFRYCDNQIINLLNLQAARLGFYAKHRPVLSNNNPIKYLGGIIKEKVFVYLTSGYFVQLMKSNTTLIFTLIELYKLTMNEKYKAVVINWIGEAIDKMYCDGIVYGIFYPLTGKRNDTGLTNSSIFIDVLMDTYIFLDKNSKYLELAKKIIDTRILNRWDNGLIPMDIGSDRTHLDNLVDFAISIRRYAEISDDNSYKDITIDIMKNTFKLHKGDKGYYTNVNMKGEPINLGKVNAIDPKYNGLLLKGIVNILTMDEKIYDNRYLHDIFKDR